MKTSPSRMRSAQRLAIRLTLILGGSTLLLNGCDPGIRTTVENGIITASQAGLGSFYQALLQLWQEQNANSNSN